MYVSDKMNFMTRIYMAVLVATLLAAIPAFAIPLGTTDKSTIIGTIVDWKWRCEINYQEQSQGRASQYVIPSHYMIRLKLKDKRSKLHDTINWFSRLLSIGTGIDGDDLGKDEILVFLPTPRLEGLKDEAKLTIEDYSISADDHGPVAKSSRILIDDKIPKPLGPVFGEEAKSPVDTKR
jgi:hypothetical protein